MRNAIKQTIYDEKNKPEKYRMFKTFRKEYEQTLHDLEKERAKILRRKKNKKEKQRALLKNTTEKLRILCIVLK